MCFELGRSSAPGELLSWRAQLTRFGHQLLLPTLDTSVTHNRFYNLMEVCFVAGFRSHNSLLVLTGYPLKLINVETGLHRLEVCVFEVLRRASVLVVFWSRPSRCVVMLPFVVSQS